MAVRSLLKMVRPVVGFAMVLTGVAMKLGLVLLFRIVGDLDTSIVEVENQLIP